MKGTYDSLSRSIDVVGRRRSSFPIAPRTNDVDAIWVEALQQLEDNAGLSEDGLLEPKACLKPRIRAMFHGFHSISELIELQVSRNPTDFRTSDAWPCRLPPALCPRRGAVALQAFSRRNSC